MPNPCDYKTPEEFIQSWARLTHGHDPLPPTNDPVLDQTNLGTQLLGIVSSGVAACVSDPEELRRELARHGSAYPTRWAVGKLKTLSDVTIPSCSAVNDFIREITPTPARYAGMEVAAPTRRYVGTATTERILEEASYVMDLLRSLVATAITTDLEPGLDPVRYRSYVPQLRYIPRGARSPRLASLHVALPRLPVVMSTCPARNLTELFAALTLQHGLNGINPGEISLEDPPWYTARKALKTRGPGLELIPLFEWVRVFSVLAQPGRYTLLRDPVIV